MFETKEELPEEVCLKEPQCCETDTHSTEKLPPPPQKKGKIKKVDFEVVDDEDDDTVPLQKSKEDNVISTFTTNRVVIFMELVKVILLFVICIVMGLALAISTHTTTVVQNAQVLPLGDPAIPTELTGYSTQLPAPTNWEYKVVSWKSDYFQGCTDIIQNPQSGTADSDYPCYCGEPPVLDNPSQRSKTANLTCSHCGGPGTNVNGVSDGYPRSNSSFVDVALREGLTNEDVFNTCSFPTRTRVMNRQYGAQFWRRGQGSMPGDETATFALPISKVESKFRDCVIEMLINMLKRDNWSLLPSPNAETLHFSNKPSAPTQLPAIPTQLPAPTNWEYKLVLWDPTYVEDCQATSQQWNGMKTGNGNTGNGPYCYCGDSMCNAEFGPDVINSDQPYNPDLNPEDTGSNLWYKVRTFGLVPPETPCNTCGRYPNSQYTWNSFESKSSFVNNALKEGLTRDELFTECDYPTMTRSINYWQSYYIGEGQMRWYDLTDEQYGASHYNFTPPTITVGDSLEVVEVEVVSCVKEKLVNRIAEGGWEFVPSPSVDSLYFRRQKV